MKAVLATNNAHKVVEFNAAFKKAGLDIELITSAQAGFNGDIDENADTFEGNAYIKAKALCDYTGLIAMADDSGLIVDVLDGRPGVFSARYAGEGATDAMNNQKLLAELDGLPESERSARFVSVICVCRPDGERLLVRGESEGIILDAPRGEGTFGYDPLFLCKKLGRTFAELDNDTKNSVSHRGAAIAELVKNIDFIIC